MKRIFITLALLLSSIPTSILAAVPQTPVAAYCAPANTIANGQALDASPVQANFVGANACPVNYGDIYADGALFSNIAFTYSGTSLNFTIPAMTWVVQGNRVYTPSTAITANANATNYYWLDIYGVWRTTFTNATPTAKSNLMYTVVASGTGISSVTNPILAVPTFLGGLSVPLINVQNSLAINFISSSANAIQLKNNVSTTVTQFNNDGSATFATGAFSISATGALSAPSLALTTPLSLANGGTGIATPAIVAGTNISTTGTFPNQTISFSGLLPLSNGGTGTTLPGGIAGSNIVLSGSFPTQTIALSANPSVTTLTSTGNTNVNGTALIGTSATASNAGDVGISRNTAPTTGFEYFGNSITHYLTFNGTSFSFTDAVTIPTLSLTNPLTVANGGTGTASPSLVGGANIAITNSFPSQTVALSGLVPIANGGTGTVSPGETAGSNIAVTGSFPNKVIAFSGILPLTNGGTGTATPSLIAGTGINVTGAYPNQTVTNTNAGVSLSGNNTFTGTNSLSNTVTMNPLGTATAGGGFASNIFYLNNSIWNGTTAVTNNTSLQFLTTGILSITSPVTLSGNLVGTTANFSGQLNALNGVFTNAVNANGLTSTGGVVVGGAITGATTGNFSSTVTAAGITSTNGVTAGGSIIGATTGVFSSTLSAAGITSTAGVAVGGAITGATTGAFSGNVVSGNGSANVQMTANGLGSGTGGGSAFASQAGGTTQIAFGNKSYILGTAYDATPYIYGSGTIQSNQAFSLPALTLSGPLTGATTINGNALVLNGAIPGGLNGDISFGRTGSTAYAFMGTALATGGQFDFGATNAGAYTFAKNPSSPILAPIFAGGVNVGGALTGATTGAFSGKVIAGATTAFVTVAPTILDVQGADTYNAAGGGVSPTAAISSTTAAGAGVGATLAFAGQTGNGVPQYAFGAVRGSKNSAAADGNYNGNLDFYTSNSGGSSVRALRLDGTQNTTLSGNLFMGQTGSISFGTSTVMNGDGTNTIMRANTAGGGVFVQNFAGTFNNAHFQDGGGLIMDRGSVNITSGALQLAGANTVYGSGVNTVLSGYGTNGGVIITNTPGSVLAQWNGTSGALTQNFPSSFTSITASAGITSTFNQGGVAYMAGVSGAGLSWNGSAGNGEATISTGYNGPTTASFYKYNGTAMVQSSNIASDGTYNTSTSSYGPTQATINGAVTASSFNVSSRRELKNNIDDIKYDPTKLLMNLKISQWCYKIEKCKPGEHRHIGPMANDAPEVLSGKKKDHIDQSAELNLAVAAMQKQNDKIELLEKKIAVLEQAVARKHDFKTEPCLQDCTYPAISINWIESVYHALIK